MWLKFVLAAALCAFTLLIVHHTTPVHLNKAALHHVLLHVTWGHAETSDAVLSLQAAHLTRVVTAMMAGLLVGLTAAAWQSLRRAPGACVQLSGLPLAASLGAIAGHALEHHALGGSLPLNLGRALPVATGFLGALLMSGAWIALTHLRAQRALCTPGMTPPAASERDSIAVLLLTGASSVWLLHRFVPTETGGAVFWLVGSFAHGHLAPWPAALVSICLGVALLTYVSRAITQLLAGDTWATLNGIDVTTTRILALVAICLLLGAAVNLAGNILGIGLMAAALARICVGDMPRLLWPTAGALGAVGAVWIDALTRAAGDVQELPVSIVCAAVAAAALVLHPKRAAGSKG